MRPPYLLPLALALALVGGCTTTTVNYSSVASPSSNIYVNEAVIHSVNPSNARIEISLSEQKARLFNGNQLALETAVSTGMQGMPTPTGSFRILEKQRVKESNLYGIWVDGHSGALLDRDGDSRSRPSGGSGSAQFQGSPMPYWLKIHPGGAGMHVGYVAGRPISHGCVRVPQRAQALIFEKVSVGTPVTVRP